MDAMHAHRATTHHLVTAALDVACASLLTDHVELLRFAWRACRDRYPFELTAGVILPDHLHCIVALPAGDGHRAARWALLRELLQHIVNGRPAGVVLDERPLADAELERHIDYVHADPVRHGVARSPRKWPYSSLHAYVERGLRSMYWTGGAEGGLRDGS